MDPIEFTFRRSLLKICKEFTEDDVEELKFVYAEVIPREELAAVTKGRELLDILLQKNIIRRDSLENLIENLREIPRLDLVKKCEDLMKGNTKQDARKIKKEEVIIGEMGMDDTVQSGIQPKLEENETLPKRPISRNDSLHHQPNKSVLPSSHDEDETPLKTTVSANTTPQLHENSRSSASLGSSYVVTDGPASGEFNDPSFHCPVNLHDDASLIKKEQEEQRKAHNEFQKTQEVLRKQKAKELINQEGVESVATDHSNSVEFLLSVGSTTTAGSASSSGTVHHTSSADDITSDWEMVPNDLQESPDADPLMSSLISEVSDRVSHGGRGHSLSTSSPGSSMQEGSEATPPQYPIRPHFIMTNEEQEATEAMNQGAPPRAIIAGAANNEQPQNGNQQSASLSPGNQQSPSSSPENMNRSGTFTTDHGDNGREQRSSHAPTRQPSGLPEQNRVASTREAKAPVKNNKNADGDETDEPRVKRQQSPSPNPCASRPPPSPPKELRGYQHELAEVGLAGNNCIICAPTGSGKTMTAGHICKERRKLNRNRRFKTLFIVCIRNLVNQQSAALKEMFDDQNVVKAFGEKQDDELKEAMNKHDVVVLTGQILVNSLKEQMVRIQDIDLLILDECHHTDQGHPYNNIMRMLLQVATDDPNSKLPQVIGLTASLGVGSNSDKPLDHYIKMCANLNCSRISYVRQPENKEELLRLNPKPSQDQIKAVAPRQNDTFSSLLRDMVWDIEKRTQFFKTSSSPEVGTQPYNAWVVQEQKEAESHGIPEDKLQIARDTIDSCEALNVLNTALEYYEDLRAIDVLSEHLDEYFDMRTLADEALLHKRWIFERYGQISEALQDAAAVEGVSDQPKLGALQNLLVELFSRETTEKPKAILLTRTIFSTRVLLKFVRDNPHLKNVRVEADRLVGKANKNGCMTDEMQEVVLKKFRDDRINLLIATDVAQEGLDIPKCNLLIRYNFVSNEIGSVQAKGRARAKQSECYLILNAGSLNERRELENLQREHKMQEALKDIDRELEHELDIKIRLKREELLEKYRMDVERKQKRGDVVRAEDVIIVCRHCKLELGRGNDMVKKGSQYIMTAPDFPQRTGFRKYAKGRDFRYDIQLGVTYCINPSCQEDLGQKMQYKHGNRSEGYTLTIKNIRFRILNHEKAHDPNNYEAFKKWSVVPFHSQIEEEKLGD